ncbi:MAG: hypothetical protein IKD78_09190, partial [Bacteroidales bacterium]|nr:hypothetical protein [Bacteroidales bacterium]
MNYKAISSTVDAINGVPKYKRSTFSKSTSIQFVNVPEGAYIEITNNIYDSNICAYYNLVSLSIDVAYSVVSKLLIGSSGSSVEIETKDDIIKRLIKAGKIANEGGNSTAASLAKNYAKSFITAVSLENESKKAKAVSELVASFMEYLDENGIDVVKILTDNLIKSGVGVAQTILFKALGTPGEILNAVMTVIDSAVKMNLMSQLQNSNKRKSSRIMLDDANKKLKGTNGFFVESETDLDSHYS